MAKKVQGTPITEQERAVLSAIFCRTNMGADDPTMKEVRRILVRHPRANPVPHYADYVADLVGHLCENDAMLDDFIKEASGWWKTLNPKKEDGTREYILSVWPRIHFLMWSEPYYVEGTARYKTEKQADSAQIKRPLSRRYKDGKSEWVVTFLSKTPLQKGQAQYEAGYPNAGVPWHKAGAVR